jgi:hypothetical protein
MYIVQHTTSGSFHGEGETGCHYHLRTGAEARQCLGGQWLVVFGASVAHGLAMNIAQLFNPPVCDAPPCDPSAWLNCKQPNGVACTHVGVSMLDLTVGVDGSVQMRTTTNAGVAIDSFLAPGAGVDHLVNDGAAVRQFLAGGTLPSGNGGFRLTWVDMRYLPAIYPLLSRFSADNPTFPQSAFRVLVSATEWYNFCSHQLEYCLRTDLLEPATSEDVTAAYDAELQQMLSDFGAALPSVPVVVMNAALDIPENVATARRVFAAQVNAPFGNAVPMLLNLNGVRVVNWLQEGETRLIVGYAPSVPETTQGYVDNANGHPVNLIQQFVTQMLLTGLCNVVVQDECFNSLAVTSTGCTYVEGRWCEFACDILICVLFVLLLRLCECFGDVHLCSLLSANANLTINIIQRSTHYRIDCRRCGNADVADTLSAALRVARPARTAAGQFANRHDDDTADDDNDDNDADNNDADDADDTTSIGWRHLSALHLSGGL